MVNLWKPQSIKCTGGKAMKKCPYCGRESSDENRCEHCFAGFPVEKQEEKPIKAEKKTRGEKHGA